MSARLDRMQAIKQALSVVDAEAKLSIDDRYEATPTVDRRQWTAHQYADLLERKVADSKTADAVAFYHGLEHLEVALMQTPADAGASGLKNIKAECRPLSVAFFADHSGSMAGERSFNLMKTVVATLEKREAAGGIVRVYPFSDRSESLSLKTYKNEMETRRRQFSGGTDLGPAWALSVEADGKNDCVAVIVSDGDFTTPLQSLGFHAGIRAVVFYAPEWSEADVTRRHASALSNKIPQAALYNGEIAPGAIAQLDVVLGSLVSNDGIVPEMAGRTRIGAVSLPSRFLLPSGMHKVLQRAQSTNCAQFLIRFSQLYVQLLASAKQDVERCFRSELFTELMSLNPTAVKFAESAIAALAVPASVSSSNVADSKSAAKEVAASDAEMMKQWANLLRAVKNVRDFMSAEYPKLREKYARDPVRLGEIDSLFLRATTVSERPEILETNQKRFGDPVGYAVFPDCNNLELLLEAFGRITTMHATPKRPELDPLLGAMFKGIRVERNKPTDPEGVSDTEIPVFRNKANGDLDIISIVRLLPGYLRSQQAKFKKGDVNAAVAAMQAKAVAAHSRAGGGAGYAAQLGSVAISNDYSFQPRTARRLCLVLRVLLNGCKDSPQWLMRALSKVKPDASVWEDVDDDNISPYWLRILRFLDAMGELPAQVGKGVEARMRAIAVKWFLFRLPDSESLQYTVPMYPGVLPFVDVEDWRPYAVFTDSKTGDFVNGANGKIISKVQVLTNPEEIAGWYRKNLGHKCVGGSYIRPTYLTDGKVTLYNQNGPNTFDILRQQLEAMKLSEAQIRAHLHTVRDRNLWLQVPYDKRGDAATMEGLSRIRKEGRTAPEITEQKDVTIYRADMVSQLSYHPDRVLAGLVRAALAYANADHAVWKEIDFLLHHSAPAAAEVENKDTKSDSKASSPPADSKSQLGQGVASPAPPRRAFDPKSGAQGVFDRQAAALVTAVASELASDKPLNSGAFDPATVFPSSVGGKFSASSASVLAKAPKPANQLGEHKGVAQAVGARPQQPAIDPELDEIFECPILLCPMKAPTFVTPCGHTFERSAIEEVKAKGAACPLCAGPIQNLVTNFLVRDLIRRSAS